MSITKNKNLAPAILALLLPLSALAGGHYSPGVEGIDGAVVPPPGVYYRGYAMHYQADRHDAVPDSDVRVDALANRLVWVTGQKVLGGDLTFETIVPVTHTDLHLASGAVDDSAWGVGDIYAGSVIGWHGQRWDAVAGAGFWSPTGQDDRPADPGLGYSELMLTLGGNLYLTERKDLSLSVLSRYEAADDPDVEDTFLVEWGLAKRLDNGLKVGLVGYDQWQLGDGDAQRHAAGLEGGYFWPAAGVGLNLAAYQEYAVNDDFKGYLLRAVLTKAF
ncbi:SphA family protein [Pseudomonas citronellolis]|uniref:SphA family protein n=1 Tax=Pseudomonas citronellolis TaxID=53408 RepID=UPI003C3020BB